MYMPILFLLFLVPAFASTPEQWWVGNTEISFVEAPQGGLVNPSCLKKENCKAALAVKNKIGDTKIGKGGAHPASTVCRENHNGQIVIAFKGDVSQSFCRFKDGSYASLDGLIK
jgi:hypothetical protein